MTYLRCPRRLAAISQDDTVRLSGHSVVHLDCRRPRDLTPEERLLLFRYCWEHVVAQCFACNASFQQHQLGGDLLAHRSYLCPRCRADLTDSLGVIFTAARCFLRKCGSEHKMRVRLPGGLSRTVLSCVIRRRCWCVGRRRQSLRSGRRCGG